MATAWVPSCCLPRAGSTFDFFLLPISLCCCAHLVSGFHMRLCRRLTQLHCQASNSPATRAPRLLSTSLCPLTPAPPPIQSTLPQAHLLVEQRAAAALDVLGPVPRPRRRARGRGRQHGAGRRQAARQRAAAVPADLAGSVCGSRRSGLDAGKLRVWVLGQDRVAVQSPLLEFAGAMGERGLGEGDPPLAHAVPPPSPAPWCPCLAPMQALVPHLRELESWLFGEMLKHLWWRVLLQSVTTLKLPGRWGLPGRVRGRHPRLCSACATPVRLLFGVKA